MCSLYTVISYGLMDVIVHVEEKKEPRRFHADPASENDRLRNGFVAVLHSQPMYDQCEQLATSGTGRANWFSILKPKRGSPIGRQHFNGLGAGVNVQAEQP